MQLKKADHKGIVIAAVAEELKMPVKQVEKVLKQFEENGLILRRR